MPLVHLAFQEGFAAERIIARIEGRIVLDKALKTRMQIGLADTVELEQPPGTTLLEIELPQRGQRGSLQLAIAEVPLYVAISLVPEGKIQIKASKEPFMYA